MADVFQKKTKLVDKKPFRLLVLPKTRNRCGLFTLNNPTSTSDDFMKAKLLANADFVPML